MTTPARVPDSFVLVGDRQAHTRHVASDIEQRRQQEAERNERSLGDYQRNSWRWNDTEALRYDLDTVIGKRDRAQAIANTLMVVSGAKGVAGVSQGRRLGPIGVAGRVVTRAINPAVSLGAFAAGATAAADARRFERQRRAIEARLLELNSRR